MDFSIPAFPSSPQKVRKAYFQDTPVTGDKEYKEEENNSVFKKRNSDKISFCTIATPPTTPHRRRYCRPSPRRLQALHDDLYGQDNDGNNIARTSSSSNSSSRHLALPRQHSTPLLGSAQTMENDDTKVHSILRRAHSAISDSTSSFTEASVPKAQKQQEQQNHSQQEKEQGQEKRKKFSKAALQQYPWNHDAWINLSRYYEAVGRNVEETVNIFYRHESIQLIKAEKEKGKKSQIQELWPKDVIKWRVLCLAFATIKHGGVPLLQRVRLHNELKRKQYSCNNTEQLDNDKEEQRQPPKKVCRRS